MPTKPATGKVLEIKLAHSPDSDDAFMFYGLATQKVRTPGLKFSHVLADIETLNQAASQEIYDVTAFSFAAYPIFEISMYCSIVGGASGKDTDPSSSPSTPSSAKIWRNAESACRGCTLPPT